MTKFRPLSRSARRHVTMRNALFRFMCEKGGWFTASALIQAFEKGGVLNTSGLRYKNGPKQPVALSNILKKDARFESRDTIVKNAAGSTHTLKEWGVLK